MKLKTIILALAVASLDGTHAATLCGVSEDAAGTLDVIYNDPGNGTLIRSGSFAESSMRTGTILLSSGTITTLRPSGTLSGSGTVGGNDFAIVSTIRGDVLNSGAIRWLSDSNSSWDINRVVPNTPPVRTVVDESFFWQSYGNSAQTWSDVFNPPAFQSGGSIGVLVTIKSPEIFDLTAPTEVRTIVPEPSSSVIASLFIAAGLLRRRVDSGGI